jgi:hypothetical protein
LLTGGLQDDVLALDLGGTGAAKKDSRRASEQPKVISEGENDTHGVLKDWHHIWGAGMYPFAESLTVVFAALAVAALFFLLAVILVSLKELGVRLANTSVGVALIRPLTLARRRPTWSRARPVEFDSSVPVATENPEVHMKRKWYSLLLRARDALKEGQQSLGGADGEPESALDPSDGDSGIAAVAEGRPADLSLLEEYRRQVNTRSTGEYTILKVAQMLQSEHMRALPGPAKRAAILVALQAAGVKVTDVIDDAVQRSEVLANAERRREKALREFELRKQEANRKLQAMVQSLVAEYDARIQRTKEEVSTEKDKFAEWKRTKAEEEQKIAGAVAYLMNESAPPA